MIPDPYVTQGLVRLTQADQKALDQLLPLVCGHLRQIAHRGLRGKRPDHTLNAAALVVGQTSVGEATRQDATEAGGARVRRGLGIVRAHLGATHPRAVRLEALLSSIASGRRMAEDR